MEWHYYFCSEELWSSMVLVGSRELFECTRKTLVLAKWELPFLSDMLIFFFLSSHAFHCSLFQCFYMLFYMFQCFPILMRCVGFQFWRSLNSDVSSLILLLYSGIFKFYCSVCKLRLAMASTLFSAIFKCFFEMNVNFNYFEYESNWKIVNHDGKN